MNNIAISDSHNYAIQQAQTNNIGKVAQDNNLRPQTADSVQAFVALAIQPGMMAAILQGQSVMVNLDMRPALLAPPVGQEKIDSEQKNELMNLIATMKGGDINKLERAAASAATVFNTQAGPLQTTGSATNGNKVLPVSSPSTAPVADAMNTRMPVAGGTDITATDGPGRQFVNMMGDLKMVELNNLLTVTLTKQEAEFSKSSANSSLRAVDAAERSGNKGIDAERQRMTGAITSGSIGLIGQGVTTARTMNALKTESKSITNNLASAVKAESATGGMQSSISSSSDKMLHRGELPDGNVTGKLGASVPSSTGFGNTKRHDHNELQLKTNQTRVTSDYSNTAINSSQKIIDGAFNVEAANETKQAELARADQTVNNEIANTHQQTAKKSAESKAALNQALENMLNSKNSTLSSIADRIR